MTDHEREMAIHTNKLDLIPKVLEFIQSETYQEKERLLQKYPELLGHEADNIMEQIEHAWRKTGDEDMYQSTVAWREFLLCVAESDFELAMLEGIFLEVLYEMPEINTGDYMARITAVHPELLNDRADKAILSVKNRLFANEDEDSEINMTIDQIRKSIQQQQERKNPILNKTEEKLRESDKKKWSFSNLFD